MQHSPTGLPIFLDNSPNMISDQIVWLVKHSNLNFQLKETPFSLSLNLKKRFAQHWLPESHPQASFATPSPSQPQPHFHPNFQNCDPHEKPTETSSTPSSASSTHQNQNLVNQISQLKQTLEIVNCAKEELEKENISLSKLTKKLTKDATDLQRKHEKVCEDIKIFKSDKDSILKELNVKSVALASAKKELKDLKNISDEKVKKFEVELVKLQVFKEETETEDREARRALKKAKQKERKKSKAKESMESLNETDEPKESSEAGSVPNVTVKNKFENLESNTEFNNNGVAFKMAEIEKEDFEEDNKTASKFLINSGNKDKVSNDTLDHNAKNTKPPDLHPSGAALKEAEVQNSEDVEEEPSETCEPVSNSSNFSGSAPLTRSDIDECLKMLSELYKK